MHRVPDADLPDALKVAGISQIEEGYKKEL